MAGQREQDERAGPSGAAQPASGRRRLWASRSPGKVVVRNLDGRVLKGYADLDPADAVFRFLPVEEPEGATVEVALRDVKAVFFVRSFAGDPAYEESKDLYQPRPPGSRKVSVTFVDGEELVGHTRQRDRYRSGLFFVPLDPRSNNLRVFAPYGAVTTVRRLL
jgi:hypothetical protein